jgi:hypothetical protein
MVAEIRVLNHIVAGRGSHKLEYRAGDVVLAALTEATEWCLRGWAAPPEPRAVPQPGERCVPVRSHAGSHDRAA